MGFVDLFLAVLILLSLGVLIHAWRDARMRRVTLDRFEAASTRDGARQAVTRTFPHRYRALTLAAGPAAALLLRFVGGLRWPYALSAATMVAAVGLLAEEAWADSRVARIERQLADAIDILVGSLRAGASFLAGLDSATNEAGEPLHLYLAETSGRIALGDDPPRVLDDLARAVPLETFRLFALTLAVHWDAGGSLASSLSLVSRTIRDRIELDRRVRSQGVEAQLSAIWVLVVAYFVAFMAFRMNPAPMRAFLESFIGSYLVAAAIVLQAVGLLWMSRLSRVRL